MAHGYTRDYLNWLQRRAWNTADRGDTITVLLYDDEADDVGHDEGVDAINTEPAGTGYARQTIDFGTVEVTTIPDEEARVEADVGTVSFDLSDSTRSIDSLALVADLEFGGSLEETLICRDALYDRVDLSTISETAWSVRPIADLYTLF